MSWSFSAMGKPEAVKRAIDESNNNKYTGQSLEEWNEAKPALLALVGANHGNIVKVSANGSASFGPPNLDGTREKTSGSCTCVIESLYGFVE